MTVLLDTHALLWAVDDPSKLGAGARARLTDGTTEILVSAGTLWELSIKLGLGKLTLADPLETWMNRALHDLRASILPITLQHAAAQVTLSFHHRDPFDRLLIAQSLVEKVSLISLDETFDRYGVSRVW